MSYVDPSLVDPTVLKAAGRYAAEHGAQLRAVVEQPDPPYPDQDNPMLRYLVHGASALLETGVPAETVILQAVVHAWYEGNIEGREQAAAPSL